jgi:hypothetical protein
MHRDGGKCFYCGRPATCIDHVIPYSASANNDPCNLVAACRECNSIVYDKTFDCLQDKRSWILKHLKDHQRVTELENCAPKTSKDHAPATVAQPFPEGVRGLLGVDDPESFRKKLKLGSLTEMGKMLGNYHPNGHNGQPVHRTTIWHIERGRAMSNEIREAYEHIAQAIVQQEAGDRMRIAARFSSRAWRFDVYCKCKCGREFHLSDSRLRHCPRCRRKTK